MRLLILAWLAPGGVLFAGLLAAAARGQILDPNDWTPCAGHDPRDPSAKQCWVLKTTGRAYCPRHDGSGVSTLLT
jgi:hypothetical protein